MKFTLLQHPHPALHAASRPVLPEEIAEVVGLKGALIDAMHSAAHQQGVVGMGISANQVGDLRRYFVGYNNELFINPQIITLTDQKTPGREGCLSRPGFFKIVARPLLIGVAYVNKAGAEVNLRQLTNTAARVFQHELDHLNGRNIWDTP